MGGEVLLGLLLLSACARIAPPPGGPPDTKPPVLVATLPESLEILPDFGGNVEFIFNETVSEGTSPNFGLGSGDLERLVLLSPTSKQAVVRWHRGRITVRPKEGWQPGRVYRAELLPGLADLRRNVMKHGTVITFTTGAPLPTTTLSGILLDWSGRRTAAGAVLDAVLLPDSLHYRTLVDSTGRFTFGPLPRGEYLVYGFLDQNKDFKRQYRETWDSVRMMAGHDTVGALWLAERDTTPPRLTPGQVEDSLSVVLSFTQPLDPYQHFDSIKVRVVQLPDSSPVPALSLLPKALDDSLHALAKARADSLRADSVARARSDSLKAHGDTSKAATRPPAPPVQPAPPVPGGKRSPVDSALIKLLATRPPVTDKLVLRVGVPLKTSTKYFIELKGIRNLNGIAGTAAGGVEVPKPPPPPKPAADSTRTKADSLKAPGDSTRIPIDSLKAKRRLQLRPPPRDSTKP